MAMYIYNKYSTILDNNVAVRRDFIGTVIAEDGYYPNNGLYNDNFWYIKITKSSNILIDLYEKTSSKSLDIDSTYITQVVPKQNIYVTDMICYTSQVASGFPKINFLIIDSNRQILFYSEETTEDKIHIPKGILLQENQIYYLGVKVDTNNISEAKLNFQGGINATDIIKDDISFQIKGGFEYYNNNIHTSVWSYTLMLSIGVSKSILAPNITLKIINESKKFKNGYVKVNNAKKNIKQIKVKINNELRNV